MKADQEMMTCDWCGKVFPADARACVEAGWDAMHDPEDTAGEEWKGDSHAVLPPGHVAPSSREKMKVEMGLDDGQLDELLRTGKVEGLGAIVCLQCQDDCSPE